MLDKQIYCMIENQIHHTIYINSISRKIKKLFTGALSVGLSVCACVGLLLKYTLLLWNAQCTMKIIMHLI